MDWRSYWIVFGASVLLSLSPGPDMAYILGRALTRGRPGGVIATLGVNLGAYVHLLAAITGLSAILMTSAVAFTVVKLIGAAYLVYIGVQTFRTAGKAKAAAPELKGVSNGAVFWQGFLCDALNPKVAVFYLAFLPQFVDPHGPRPILQLLIYGVTTNMVGGIVNLILVMVSTSLKGLVQANASTATLLKRALGMAFVGLGAQLALQRAT
jgi:threonine/homoserine/homoserine lactone efflux protein